DVGIAAPPGGLEEEPVVIALPVEQRVRLVLEAAVADQRGDPLAAFAGDRRGQLAGRGAEGAPLEPAGRVDHLDRDGVVVAALHAEDGTAAAQAPLVAPVERADGDVRAL